MTDCIDHLDFCGAVCPDCGEQVDAYGNTESQWHDYCAFPDCGCDGSRLCTAKEGASERAVYQNVEGMWHGKSEKHKKARQALIIHVMEEKVK